MPNLSFGERIAQGAWRVAPKRLLSGMIGWGAKRRLPKRLQISLLRCYAKAYGLNSAEAEHPIEHYPSLQAFFTRRLAPGSRNAPTDEHSLVAPSDGTICEAGLATAGKLLEAKGSVFTLQTLLADDALAARLAPAMDWISAMLAGISSKERRLASSRRRISMHCERSSP